MDANHAYSQPDGSARRGHGHLTFIHGDIGPTKHLGFPALRLRPEQAMNYVGAIGRTLQAHEGFDTVLVDGRFRLACLLFSRRFLGKRGRVLIHDFADHPMGGRVGLWRARYQIWSRALDHYRIEQQSDTLALLEPLDNTTIPQRELIEALRTVDR